MDEDIKIMIVSIIIGLAMVIFGIIVYKCLPSDIRHSLIRFNGIMWNKILKYIFGLFRRIRYVILS